jgi:xanthine dehydrogenase large subunit
LEVLGFDGLGGLATQAPSPYQIPPAHDVPRRFDVAFFDRPNPEATIHRSKATGEPPLMLALAGFHALRDAIASLAKEARRVSLSAPATPERVLAAVEEMRDERA